MSQPPHPILCIGSVLWDIIGKSDVPMRAGSDQPGHIRKIPGGVALNIAMALGRFHLDVELLSSVGRDADGDALLNELQMMGLGTKYLHRSAEFPTDFYMAIESPNGVLGAIADAHSLEKVGAEILTPLSDGRLGASEDPFDGSIVLDGNLTLDLLQSIAGSAPFKGAQIFVAPASPGKAERLRPFFGQQNASLFVNKEEAEILCGTEFADSAAAAETLAQKDIAMAVVTDGPRMASVITKDQIVTQTPAPVTVKRFTGAGDTFMAAYVCRHLKGDSAAICLSYALEQTNAYISTEA